MKSKKKLKKQRQSKMSSPFDIQGSWTGNYLFGETEEPVQDVDDL